LKTSEHLTQPLGVPRSLHQNPQQPSGSASNSQIHPRSYRTPLPLGSDHSTAPDQQSLSLSHPQPLSIPTATSLATSQILNRPKNQHAQNLLVDVAETATEIFPYELIARRHGCATFKVVEALAAVVQVPLLRCAIDKRRAGKLGAERVKEVREMRKAWGVRERERERLRKEQERRCEITGDGVRSQEGNGGEERDGENTRQQEKSTESRSVFVSPAPGQPSALDVAQMLGPMEMPGVLTGNGVFTGQWW
jgi:stalled ribosome alternative rescue factor ArfA